MAESEVFMSPIDKRADETLFSSFSENRETASLEQLQSSEQVQLLDAIDTFRSQGINQYISVPQLVVCGEQSSGKSSVLEGLTRLRFPTKDTLCTTFATEVSLRNCPEVSIKCTITPAPKRQDAHAKAIKKFEKSFQSRADFCFPDLLDDARACMATAGSVKAFDDEFFDDILRIEYAGPDLPRLTVVDLPGLTQSDLGNNNNAPAQVEALVRRYMKEAQSIVLMIVSAQNDLENQMVLQLARSVLNGSRVLGIVTKPDKLDVGSGKEKKIIDLMNNMTSLRPEHGWHAVKNRDFTTSTWSNSQRDNSEQQFFNSGVWSVFPKDDVGIDALRTKLSQILFRQIQKELPKLIKTIDDQITDTKQKLAELGSSRDKPEEQRLFLTKKAEGFQWLTGCALKGIYTEPFFTVKNGQENARLRTKIQNLNLAFANTMYRKGHAMEVMETKWPEKPQPNGINSDFLDNYDCQFNDPIPVQRQELLQGFIHDHVRQSRPSGLPSLVNPWVISEIFREQSLAWEDIAEYHMNQVFDAVTAYLEKCLTSLMDYQTFDRLWSEKIQPELDSRKAILDAKLEEILKPYTELDPTTYDPQYICDIDEIRARRRPNSQGENNTSPAKNSGITFGKNHSKSGHLLMESLDDFTNSEILDLMQTYYKSAISIFINNVAVLGIESCLIANLTSIFSPSLVTSMNNTELNLIAAECSKTRAKRASLTRKLDALTKGKRVLRIYAVSQPRTHQPPSPSSPQSTTPRSRHQKRASQRANQRSDLRESLRAAPQIAQLLPTPTVSQTPQTVQAPPTPERSRPHTPNPKRADTIDKLAMGFDQLSVTPPPEPHPRRLKASPFASGKNSWRKVEVETDEEEEEEESAFERIMRAKAEGGRVGGV